MQKAPTNKNPTTLYTARNSISHFWLNSHMLRVFTPFFETPNNPFCTWSDSELWLGHVCFSCCMCSHTCTPVSQGTRPIAPAHGPSLGDEVAARLSPLRPEMKPWLSLGKWLSISKEYLNFGTKRNAASSCVVTGGESPRKPKCRH